MTTEPRSVDTWIALVRRSRLSKRARFLAYMLGHRLDRRTLSKRVSRFALAADMGVSVKTVERGIAELRRLGYLHVESGRAAYECSTYRATRPWWLDAHPPAPGIDGATPASHNFCKP